MAPRSSSTAFKPVVRRPVYRQVADEIAEAILRGDLGPGDSLPTERELGETFGVSRASVREALRHLQAQGLVSGGGGTNARMAVATGDIDVLREGLANLLRLQRVSLADLVELRCALEDAALRRAADRPAPERLEEARRALAEMDDPDVTPEGFDAADVRFHVALVAASGNQAMHLVMLAARHAVARHLLDSLHSLPDPPATFRTLARQHARILRAVEDGDGEQAALLVRRHILGFYRSVEASGSP
jgi:GntR family transcriptional repressor for pyruvate dehydrogenase complex